MITKENRTTLFARDMAIGWVVLAALKAKSRIESSQTERDAAGQLRELLLRERKVESLSYSIPPSFVTDDVVRDVLDRSLAEIPVGALCIPILPDQIDDLIKILEALEHGEIIDKFAAEELLGLLIQPEGHPALES